MVIDGKIIVFTDQHFGIKGNAKNRLEVVKNVFNEIRDYMVKNDIHKVISCGDIFHSRSQIDVNTINAAYESVQKLAELGDFYLIVGNHDSYLKNTIDINSLIMFNNVPNVSIINEPTECSVNGNKSLLVPWLGDVRKWPNETFDMMFGHFDASHKYIIKAYIEDHSRQSAINSNIANKLNSDDLISCPESQKDAGDYIGDFIEVVKKSGTIFSGHIHGNREFLAKGRNFILVGDPYQQNLGEKDYRCGFYVINEDNTYEFHEITTTPRHVEIRMSQVTEESDLSFVKGNIVHKIYDIDVDRALDAKITQKITDWKPFEELLPDYEVDLANNKDIKLQNESIALIKKSKLEYVQNYIKNIDKNTLDEQNINADKLYEVLERYYNLVTEDE